MPSSSTDRFVAAWRRRKPDGERQLDELLALYREPHRHYHGVSHIADLLNRAERLRFDDREVVMAAIFYHDAIYNVAATDNEERSAVLALEALPALGCGGAFAKTVAAMIRATALHERTGDADTDLFLDLDMAILADPLERYAVYRQAIMDEYRTVHSGRGLPRGTDRAVHRADAGARDDLRVAGVCGAGRNRAAEYRGRAGVAVGQGIVVPRSTLGPRIKSGTGSRIALRLSEAGSRIALRSSGAGSRIALRLSEDDACGVGKCP